jgi:hypothetical protein
VTASLKQQGREVPGFLVAAWQAHHHRQPMPSLIPQGASAPPPGLSDVAIGVVAGLPVCIPAADAMLHAGMSGLTVELASFNHTRPDF